MITSRRLNCGCGRVGRPRLVRVEERRDRVLVAVEVAGLEADDERDRDALGRGRRLDLRLGRRVLRVVGLKGAGAVGARAGDAAAARRRALGQVEELEARRLVALRVLRALLAGPRLDLRAGEDRAADRVVGDDQPRGAAAADARDQRGRARPAARRRARRGCACRRRACSTRVTLRRPAVSRSRERLTPRGSVTRTSASPPETRSARFESTLIFGAGRCLSRRGGKQCNHRERREDSGQRSRPAPLGEQRVLDPARRHLGRPSGNPSAGTRLRLRLRPGTPVQPTPCRHGPAAQQGPTSGRRARSRCWSALDLARAQT